MRRMQWALWAWDAIHLFVYPYHFWHLISWYIIKWHQMRQMQWAYWDAIHLFFVHNSANFLNLNLKFCTFFLSCIFKPLHRSSTETPPVYILCIILLNSWVDAWHSAIGLSFTQIRSKILRVLQKVWNIYIINPKRHRILQKAQKIWSRWLLWLCYWKDRNVAIF